MRTKKAVSEIHPKQPLIYLFLLFFSINVENFIAFDARSILSLWVAQAICHRHLPTFLLQRWLRIGSSSLSST